MPIEFTLNGKPVTVESPGMARLLDVLREELRATGSKEGCGEGECGACTVRIDGAVAMSCLVPVCQAEGRQIQTVEGIGDDPRLAGIQRAFVEHGGAQCGICTPGFIVASAALLDENPRPTREEVRVALSGNLCRCTGYQKIVDAVVAAVADVAV